MTSALPYITNIDTDYPVPGVFNNAQGFRNNFGNISQALSSLDSYMNSLANPPANIDAPYVTATTLVSLGTLQLDTSNLITVGSSNETKIQGFNPDGTAATGAVAFFPNIVPVAVQNISESNGSITVINTTTGILEGASFIPASTSTVYTVTGISGYTIFVSPSPTFDDAELNITNPIFNDYTVINLSTITNLIAQAFEGAVTLTAGTDSTASTTGTLVVQGGVGISGNLNVNQNANIIGDINLGGNYSSAASNTVLSGLTVSGNITLADANDDASPTLILNVNSWDSEFTPNGGYQIFPNGMIWMWGISPLITFDGLGSIVFPTIPGYSNPGFPNACVNAQTVTTNGSVNTNYAMTSQLANISAQGLTFNNNKTHYGASGSSPVAWFAIGY